MGLAPETIESIDLMAKKLDEWAIGWGRRLRDVKSSDLGEFRKVLLTASSQTEFRSVTFMTEFHSGLANALEEFDRVYLELLHNTPHVAGEIGAKQQQLLLEAGWVRDLSDESYDWLKAFNRSRNTAQGLAKTLRHAAQMALLESPCQGSPSVTLSDPEAELSRPMTKSEMMTALHMDGYKKFNTWGKAHGLQDVGGNRQLWQVRLDTLDKRTRAILEEKRSDSK
jgi:hypothetical protein